MVNVSCGWLPEDALGEVRLTAAVHAQPPASQGHRRPAAAGPDAALRPLPTAGRGSGAPVRVRASTSPRP